jgi:catechol 2,3-dioxygenase-like lactoylglutathione lyase family enzyme
VVIRGAPAWTGGADAHAGFIDHIGIGVPDRAAAKAYCDEPMPIPGLRPWFPTTAAGEFNYGPRGATGAQIFFYQAPEPGPSLAMAPACSTLSFMVARRATVREAHDRAAARQAEVVHEPREFPEYAAHCATYFVDPHGFVLKIVCRSAGEI